ncbi:MAG: hypothetical protein HOV80_10560 [Polyangiaceae bacterium]|nr:hypothetical protein [Polyangiaceae bacterium]
MAEEKSKKPKIDLKARLGKAPGGGVPGALPSGPGVPSPSQDGIGRISAPPSSGGMPAPVGIAPPAGIAPPPGIASGMGLNPFAPKPQPKAAPVSAEAQTIKVEVSEEIHDERKRAGRRALLYSAIAAVVFAGIGFFAGGMREVSKRDAKAVEGLKKLEPEVTDSAKKAEEILPILDDIEKGLLKDRKYPDSAIEKLSITIPNLNLDDKSFGTMPSDIQKATLSYMKKIENANEKKDRVKNLLGSLKKPIETSWAEDQKPVFKLGIIFRQAGSNTIGEVVQMKEPWEVAKSDWPKEPKIVVSVMQEGKRVPADQAAQRWEQDAIVPTDQTPLVIPIEPSSVSGFTDERTILQLVGAVNDVRVLLNGDETPGREVVGLLKEGQGLAKSIDSKVAKAAR